MAVLLQLNNIHKNYGARVILNDANASFSENQKVGMIGRNGAGKSTLCKIIIGEEESDSGEIIKSSNLRLSYLEQHDPYTLDETVIDFLMRYTEQEEWRCGKIAGRFQLKNEILKTKIGALSGGFRTRVKLTAMLLSDPNLIILDEPTNYLDLKTLILLENFLQDWEGAFIIVSHDREFLKKTCEHTLEVENGACMMFPGSVENYLIFKEEQKAVVESFNRTIIAKQKQLQLFVDRFGAKASKASQAKSKQRQIDRMKTIDVGHALSNVNIRIPAVDRRNGMAVRCDDLSIGYPGKTVAARINMEIDQGQHVAVLGDNGQGKTTFLRTLAEDLDRLQGEFRWGYGLKIAYYAQHVFTTLRPDDDVYTHMASMATPDIGRQEILNLAGSFLFKGDEVKKKVSVLSGGERARLVLAGLLLTKSNVLLLDEPTNHLDFETVEALGSALKKFQGTIFFISHDRTFVNLVATEIVEVKNGQVARYPGSYEDYVYRLENFVLDELDEAPAPSGNTEKKAAPKSGKEAYLLKKELESERRKITSRLKKSEEKLEALKREREVIHQELLKDPNAWSVDKNARFEDLGGLIEEEERVWLDCTQQAEAAELRKKEAESS